MIDPEHRRSGLPDWMALVLALAGFWLFLYAGRHSGSWFFSRLLGP
jgi:hypothetical protein